MGVRPGRSPAGPKVNGGACPVCPRRALGGLLVLERLHRPAWTALAIAALLGLTVLVPAPTGALAGSSAAPLRAPPSLTVPQLSLAPRGPVADWAGDAAAAGARPIGSDPSVSLLVDVAFALSNASRVAPLLAALSDPASPEYHHYLSRAQFDSEFGGASAPYAEAVSYFASFGVTRLSTFEDRLALSFEAPAPVLDRIFGTSLEEFARGSSSYVAPVGPLSLPAPIASAVTQVLGLGTGSDPTIGLDLGTHVARAAPDPAAIEPSVSGYLPPGEYAGTQYEFAPDFQIADDVAPLYQLYGYPTTETVATILWAGVYEGVNETTPYGPLTDGQLLGPYVPSDVDSYFNQTLPAGEPHPTVEPIPIDGAPYPSELASWDSIGAVFENTLDLEMVGSTAPGAHLFNVYAPGASFADLDQAFTTVLQPNATASGLDNVSVVSNSWYGEDINDTTWTDDLVQAQMRGISVLACSGDSDDNNASSKAFGVPGEWAAFPGTDASGTYGVVSVGGTTVTLDPTSLAIQSEVAWNISANDSTDGGPAGSEGGISALYPEPSWQRSTEANEVLEGAGRGVPDLAQLANNTLMTLSQDGYQYNATNISSPLAEFAWAWGTSIACPLDAGIVATIDRALLVAAQPRLGFFDPALYAIANAQFEGTSNHSAVRDVTVGSNYAYSALAGYDLVTGWGSLDALNFTDDLLPTTLRTAVTFTATGLGAGVDWFVNVTGSAPAETAGTSQVVEFSPGLDAYSLGTDNASWTTNPVHRTIYVGTAAQTVGLVFYEFAYSVSFSASWAAGGSGALPAWQVTIGPDESGSPSGPVDFLLPNGTYAWSVSLPSGYDATPASGSVTVDGANQAESFVIANVTSTPPPPTSGSPSNALPTIVLVGILVAVGAVLVGLVAIGLRRRRRPKGPAPGSSAPVPPPGAWTAGPPPPPPPPPPPD